VKSLRSSDGFRQFVLDQLEPLDVTAKSMFGGTGLYARGVFFGIIAMDALYLRVDDSNRRQFEREGMKPFKPYPNRPVTMKYYEVPLSILESAPELVEWARTAIAVAEKPGSAATAEGAPKRGARSAPRVKPRRSTAAAGRGRNRR
jgi:DNA transformation protein